MWDNRVLPGLCPCGPFPGSCLTFQLLLKSPGVRKTLQLPEFNLCIRGGQSTATSFWKIIINQYCSRVPSNTSIVSSLQDVSLDNTVWQMSAMVNGRLFTHLLRQEKNWVWQSGSRIMTYCFYDGQSSGYIVKKGWGMILSSISTISSKAHCAQ